MAVDTLATKARTDHVHHRVSFDAKALSCVLAYRVNCAQWATAAEATVAGHALVQPFGIVAKHAKCTKSSKEDWKGI